MQQGASMGSSPDPGQRRSECRERLLHDNSARPGSPPRIHAPPAPALPPALGRAVNLRLQRIGGRLGRTGGHGGGVLDR